MTTTSAATSLTNFLGEALSNAVMPAVASLAGLLHEGRPAT
ncbi:hypothetical protein [Nocardia sp. NPDC006630]